MKLMQNGHELAAAPPTASNRTSELGFFVVQTKGSAERLDPASKNKAATVAREWRERHSPSWSNGG
jgi:hypothetical protein